MKILIVEDEKAAMRNLQTLIAEVCPTAEFVGELDSVRDCIEWFEDNDMPELVFMDIHLADGSAFEIFENVRITCPIIFTTAYDEYALRAFKVNSIDYLLKPISKSDLKKSFEKLQLLKKENDPIVDKIIKQLNKEENFKTHFLIPDKGDKYIPLAVDTIMYFYIADGIVKAVNNDGKHYTFSQSLDELNEQLNPKMFFRANRQFLICKKAIKDVSIWFNGRLVINMVVPNPSDEKIIISKAKSAEFKAWF